MAECPLGPGGTSILAADRHHAVAHALAGGPRQEVDEFVVAQVPTLSRRDFSSGVRWTKPGIPACG